MFDSRNFQFIDNPNFDKCYELKSKSLLSHIAVDECGFNSRDFQFIDNHKF